MKRFLLLIAFVVGSAASLAAQSSAITQLRNSKHDFSVVSTASVKATAEDARCVFCHTPHNAKPAVPLWNQKMSQGFTYQVYESSTLKATIGQPPAGDNSRLCLSCHDGTVALGDTVNNGLIPFRNLPADQKLPSSNPSNLAGTGLNLADDHPFAFVPDLSNSQIRLPPTGDAVKLDLQGRVQCTSCHDPHNETLDPVEKRFLVKNNSAAAICITCHDLKGGSGVNVWSWSGTQGPPSDHKISGKTYTTGTNAGLTYLGAHTGYTTTATNACASCHRSHTRHESPRLIKGQTDMVCFQCHDGNPLTALRDVKSQFRLKMYVHPSIGPQAGHDPSEPPGNIITRHAACDDCHNPHAVRADAFPVVPPQLSGALLGRSGIAESGVPRDPRRGTGEALYEYEVCLKCHAYNANKPQIPGYQAYGPLPRRQLPSTDLRLSFTSSAAWHPVARARGLSAGPTGDMPSLLTTVVDANGTPILGRLLSPSSQIYCSDCHNNDSGRNLGSSFTGPAGPHGSNVNHILERKYVIESPTGAPGNTPNIPYMDSNYALCFKCHSELSLRSDASFRKHREHTDLASCATCHDPHGVPNGISVANGSLINFDLNIVAPSSSGRLEFRRTGLRQGTCYLRCHGADHNPLSYGP